MTIFRAVIALSVCILFLQVVVPYLDGPWVTEKELDVLSYGGYGAMLGVPGWFFWIWLALWFVSVVGMYFFLTWSRWLFLICVLFSVVVLLVTGMQIQTSVDAFLSDAGGVLDGLLLALAFFSTVRDRFETRRE